MKIKDVFGDRRIVLSIDEESTLAEAAETMHENAVGALIVTKGIEEKKAVGIITERDVIAAIAVGADPSVAKVKDYMTRWRDIIYSTPEEDVKEALQKMLNAGVRHLVIVENDEVVGVLSIRDLCAASLIEK